jgi:hypothetical protein
MPEVRRRLSRSILVGRAGLEPATYGLKGERFPAQLHGVYPPSNQIVTKLASLFLELCAAGGMAAALEVGAALAKALAEPGKGQGHQLGQAYLALARAGAHQQAYSVGVTLAEHALGAARDELGAVAATG